MRSGSFFSEKSFFQGRGSAPSSFFPEFWPSLFLKKTSSPSVRGKRRQFALKGPFGLTAFRFDRRFFISLITSAGRPMLLF